MNRPRVPRTSVQVIRDSNQNQEDCSVEGATESEAGPGLGIRTRLGDEVSRG